MGLAFSKFGSAPPPLQGGTGWVCSHTALCPEGGGYGREDGDEDVEDFSPGGVVVESSHSVKVGFEG